MRPNGCPQDVNEDQLSFFRLFRRDPPVASRAALGDFIDTQGAFLSQKGMFEYSRARAGPYGNILFSERTFLDELEKSRWLGYPLALAMVAEAVEGVLRAAAGERLEATRQAVVAVTLAAFDRYPTPIPAEDWTKLRVALAQDLAFVGMHPVKRVMDVPQRFLDRYVAAMPIHDKLRAKDDATIHNYLKTNLCNIHADFVRRVDMEALIASLTEG